MLMSKILLTTDQWQERRTSGPCAPRDGGCLQLHGDEPMRSIQSSIRGQLEKCRNVDMRAASSFTDFLVTTSEAAAVLSSSTPLRARGRSAAMSSTART